MNCTSAPAPSLTRGGGCVHTYVETRGFESRGDCPPTSCDAYPPGSPEVFPVRAFCQKDGVLAGATVVTSGRQMRSHGKAVRPCVSAL